MTSPKPDKLPLAELGYSMRRYFVDQYYFQQVQLLPQGSVILDLGGNKINKRGFFDVEGYDFKVIYGNFSTEKRPDVQMDAGLISFKDSVFDAVICAELLEHIYTPPQVLKEVLRILKPGGVLLATTPFLFPIHSDPYDYGRYTDQYYSRMLNDLGFQNERIERQGRFWCVAADILRGLAYERRGRTKSWRSLIRKIEKLFISWFKKKAIRWDAEGAKWETPYLNGFTTGFGVTAYKPRSG